MYRRWVVFFAGFLAVLAAVVPLAGIAAYARYRASAAEQEHRLEYSNWTLMRAGRQLAYTKAAFRKLEAENWRGCSPDHIARMRQVTVDTRTVDEVGYFIDGKLACTSWGMVTKDIAKGTPDAMLPDGFGLYLNVRPKITGGAPTLVLAHGDYNVLMRPERLVDVLTDTAMTLGIATLDGKLVAINGTAGLPLAHRIARTGGFGRSGALVYASSQDRNFRAFAITDHSLVETRVDRELWLLVPIGLAVSAHLVCLVVWLSRQRLSLEREIAIAIKRREFRVCYQPIIELSTGLCVGAEALLRWERADGSCVLPDLFIPLAERNDLIEPLTDLMIACVVEDLAEMLRRKRNVHIAINISSADMQSGRFLPILTTALARTNVAPEQIWLEATERGFMNAAAARATLEIARAQGHPVAIDDFGTGYSSLSLLELLPLDALKVDKSFIRAIGKSAATSAVIPHIIDMAHGLNFKIIAEGVETLEQEAYLRSAGVEFAQGWLYSQALPAADFLRYYERTNADAPSPEFRGIAG
ncbi:sensor c-di-GMP phosphodiesterase-like protein [Novosphingobium sp. PhB165]|nr:sensor c-di-GMP phosphodiesterase-like protein [Novosphingobium sp. PhB165]